MVEYAIEALVRAGVTEVMVVTAATYLDAFVELLGDGSHLGLAALDLGGQERAGGIAEALGLAKSFVGSEPMVVMLADNIVERSLRPTVAAFEANPVGARLVLSEVTEPEHLRHLGIAEFGDHGEVIRVHEKPQDPPSNYAVTGVYCYDATVFDVISTLVPSGRGELEITDVNNHYIATGNLAHDVLAGFWGDAGESMQAYEDVNDFVATHGVNKD